MGDPLKAAPTGNRDDAEELTAEFLAWVQQHFATVEFLSAETKIRWCPTWWEHPEVVARLKALWLAFQGVTYSDDFGALSSWWLHDWDLHRAVLFDDKGPFRNCDVEHGHLWVTSDKRVVPTPQNPPAGWVLPT